MQTQDFPLSLLATQFDLGAKLAHYHKLGGLLGRSNSLIFNAGTKYMHVLTEVQLLIQQVSAKCYYLIFPFTVNFEM